MAHPVGYEEKSGRFQSQIRRCTHGVFQSAKDSGKSSSACSICRSGDFDPRAGRKYSKVIAELAPEIEDGITETDVDPEPEVEIESDSSEVNPDEESFEVGEE